jgi:hypothetical protein
MGWILGYRLYPAIIPTLSAVVQTGSAAAFSYVD